MQKYAYFASEESRVMGQVMNRALVLCLLLVAGSVLAQETAQVTLPSVTLSVGGQGSDGGSGR